MKASQDKGCDVTGGVKRITGTKSGAFRGAGRMLLTIKTSARVIVAAPSQ